MSQRSDLVKRSVFPLCALEIYQFLISELQGNSVYLFKDHKGTIKLTYLHHFSILTIPICFEIYILLNKNKKKEFNKFHSIDHRFSISLVCQWHGVTLFPNSKKVFLLLGFSSGVLVSFQFSS